MPYSDRLSIATAPRDGTLIRVAGASTRLISATECTSNRAGDASRPAATAQQGTLGRCAPRLGGVNAPN
jgi:hypothetical protein